MGIQGIQYLKMTRGRQKHVPGEENLKEGKKHWEALVQQDGEQ
jgi:hypothetical protein